MDLFLRLKIFATLLGNEPARVGKSSAGGLAPTHGKPLPMQLVSNLSATGVTREPQQQQREPGFHIAVFFCPCHLCQFKFEMLKCSHGRTGANSRLMHESSSGVPHFKPSSPGLAWFYSKIAYLKRYGFSSFRL